MTHSVNSISVVDSTDGATFEYEGPFKALRDGGQFEVTVPIETDDPGAILEPTAESVKRREGDFLIARADGSINGSGEIIAANILEGDLLFRVDDPAYADHSDVEIPDELLPNQ